MADIDMTVYADEWIGQAEWREGKAVEFPDDAARNLEAAKTFRNLAEMLSSGYAIRGDIVTRINQIADDDDRALAFTLAQSEVDREVGFHFYPETPDDLLEAVLTRAGA